MKTKYLHLKDKSCSSFSFGVNNFVNYKTVFNRTYMKSWEIAQVIPWREKIVRKSS